MPFGGLSVQNISANIYGDKYAFKSFSIRNHTSRSDIEYSGWINPGNMNVPFVIRFSEYNAERKIYPLQIAFSTGAEALIADVALEGTSKMPIDFVVRGEIPNIEKSGQWFNIDMMRLPKIKLNIAGGIDRKKVSFRKSSVSIEGTSLTFSGSYDWSKSTPVIKAKITSDGINIYKSFPEWFGVGKEWIHPKRELNIFHDMPLFGQFLYGVNADIELDWKHFVVYRSLDLSNMKAKVNIQNHNVSADASLTIGSGDIRALIVGKN